MGNIDEKYIDMVEIEGITVPLSPDELEETCYWIVQKFNEDPLHNKKTSFGSSLLGDFFDRWMNRSPELLIFNKLLKVHKKNYVVVNDNFLYNIKTAKNAPDVLGLKDNFENFYPFALFNDGVWELQNNAPFVEMKTFKNNHAMVTIPWSSFDKEKFYVIVFSHIDQNYLISLFKDSFFSEKNYNKLKINKRFIKSDVNGDILTPKKIKKPELGKYELLGIYTGKELIKWGIKVGSHKTEKNEFVPDKPRYLKSIEILDEEYGDEGILLKQGLYYHKSDEEENIPFFVEIGEDSEIKILKDLKTYILIKVSNHVEVDGIGLDSGYYKLRFNFFQRDITDSELIISKNTLRKKGKDQTDYLISLFDKFIQNSDK